MYIYIFFKFKKKINIFVNFNFKKISKINKKKNLFFKKRGLKNKFFLSRRLTIVLRKKKNIKKKKFLKKRNLDKGYFFFKKFFLKTLYKSRKFLKLFFFLPNIVRQKKISKLISKNSKKLFSKNLSYEYTLLVIIYRSNIFLFLRDCLKAIINGLVYVNNVLFTNHTIVLNEGDCIQFNIKKNLYKYIKTCKKFFKKKVKLHRYNSWKFYKQKFFKKKAKVRWKKRKNPKYLFLFYLFKLNSPKFLEIDYLTLTIFVLKKHFLYTNTTYFLSKLFTFRLFSLYNFKKVN